MSVIVDLTFGAEEFTLGTVLSVDSDTRIVLETLVPLGERSVPFIRLRDGTPERFAVSVGEHAVVDDIYEIKSDGGESLFALDWDESEDQLFEAIRTMDATLLAATCRVDTWAFQLRFESHETLSEFLRYCADADISFEVAGVYNPTAPDAGPWYGLTAVQRETLVRAVEGGYYSIPRQLSTADLAAEFGISDQAVTERLRRAITTLVSNTLAVADEEVR